jgi:hypothetical protein
LTVAAGDGHTVWLPLPASAVGSFAARYLGGSIVSPIEVVN